MVYVMENLENPNLKRMIDNWENHGLETSIYNHIYISETQIFAICGIQVMKKWRFGDCQFHHTSGDNDYGNGNSNKGTWQ